ncbi:MAG: hypothetical protein WCL18_09815 [bacterium]
MLQDYSLQDFLDLIEKHRKLYHYHTDDVMDTSSTINDSQELQQDVQPIMNINIP